MLIIYMFTIKYLRLIKIFSIFSWQCLYLPYSLMIYFPYFILRQLLFQLCLLLWKTDFQFDLINWGIIWYLQGFLNIWSEKLELLRSKHMKVWNRAIFHGNDCPLPVPCSFGVSHFQVKHKCHALKAYFEYCNHYFSKRKANLSFCALNSIYSLFLWNAISQYVHFSFGY